jgi:hypothetical protein
MWRLAPIVSAEIISQKGEATEKILVGLLDYESAMREFLVQRVIVKI